MSPLVCHLQALPIPGPTRHGDGSDVVPSCPSELSLRGHHAPSPASGIIQFEQLILISVLIRPFMESPSLTGASTYHVPGLGRGAQADTA